MNQWWGTPEVKAALDCLAKNWPFKADVVEIERFHDGNGTPMLMCRTEYPEPVELVKDLG